MYNYIVTKGSPSRSSYYYWFIISSFLRNSTPLSAKELPVTVTLLFSTSLVFVTSSFGADGLYLYL